MRFLGVLDRGYSHKKHNLFIRNLSMILKSRIIKDIVVTH